MKKSIVLLLSFLMSSNSWAVIGFDSSCPLFYDCCKGLKVNDGVVSCDEVCASDEACTPVGCCKRNERVCTNKCCKVCGNELGECCLEEKICNNDCCEEGEECVGGSCCASENKCGEGESQTCCSDGETCVGGSCCDDDKVCGEGESQTCCGSDEECVSGVCCPSEKKCGDTCCSADQECIEGECKCPEDKPTACGEACCDGPCNADNTGCCENQCGDTCCSAEQECIEGECKCPEDKPTACGEGESLTCCGDSEECVGGSCCASANKCGDNCCENGEACSPAEECCPYVCGASCCDEEGCDDTGNACAGCRNDQTKCGESDNTWCCPSGDTCGRMQGQCCLNGVCCDGKAAVTNYNSAGEVIGVACCEIQADEAVYYDNPTFGEHWSHLTSGYTVSGAINGGCCGGWSFVEGDNNGPIEGAYRSYSILVNSGGAYCGMSYNSYEILGPFTDTGSGWYVDSTRFCYEYDSPAYETSGSGCSCSDSGDPRNGSPCN